MGRVLVYTWLRRRVKPEVRLIQISPQPQLKNSVKIILRMLTCAMDRQSKSKTSENFTYTKSEEIFYKNKTNPGLLPWFVLFLKVS